MPEESTPSQLRPDERIEDYVRFYDEIGSAQLEERYYGEHAEALARFEVLQGLLRPFARAGSSLLDIGSASGHYSVRYAREGGTVTGLDISQASIDLFRERARSNGVEERCHSSQGDVRDLPFDDATFDVVLLTEVIEHVREQRRALEEVARVLRPGGTLILSTPHALDRASPRTRFRYRGAETPEAAGIEVKRTDRNDIVEAAGIDHAPYYHDAFTFRQIEALCPPSLRTERLHSLWFAPPPAMMAAGGVIWRKLARAPSSAGPTADEVSAPQEGPVAMPEPDAGVRAIVGTTHLVWRIPIARLLGEGILLVARRRAP